jgi:hypothetical protein
MPISAYFKGEGSKVMSSMRKEYGPRAKSVFYATANKTGMKPSKSLLGGMKTTGSSISGSVKPKLGIKSSGVTIKSG